MSRMRASLLGANAESSWNTFNRCVHTSQGNTSCVFSISSGLVRTAS